MSMPVAIDNLMSISELDLVNRFLKKIEHPGASIRPNHMVALGFPNSLAASEVKLESPVYPLNDSIEDNKAIMAITKMLVKSKEELQNFYGIEMDMVQATYTAINPGPGIPLHSDTTTLDGRPLREDGVPEEMEWSAVFYINTSGVDYLGGEIYFPDQNYMYIPKAGSLIHFIGDSNHAHLVRDVIRGSRMAIAIFFARKGNISSESFF
jgi:predicted 2-oxoglutarate/Fe(II)-dependent dioxygenase YbiX